MLPLSKSTASPRKYDLDWLRVLAFTLLIFYHTGMFFVSWGWHIKNNEISEAMEWPMRFLSQWRMPLLFIISGAGVYFALGRRSGGTFLTERTKRILLPLIFGMFVIVPPQIYYERLTQGATFSYVEFYQTVFQFRPYPEGSFSWHHLWYLAYIFTYSLICLPLFLYLRSEKGKKTLHALSQLLSTKAGIYLLTIPLFISEASLRPYWPTNQNLIADWANFTLSLLLFIYGFIICSQERIRQRIEDLRYISLSIAMVAITILVIYYWIQWPDPSPAGMVVYRALTVLNGWCWLMAIFGFARKYLNFSNGFLKYANEAVYPFYILHQTIIICIAYYMINWQMSIALKFFIISSSMFLLTLFLYECIIRRVNFLRVLFGLKWKAKSKNKAISASGSTQLV